jgi:hypothetical protein
MYDTEHLEYAMTNSAADDLQIDHQTTRSICHAVGERLRQNMHTDSAQLPPRLQALMDDLRRQDRAMAAH